MDGLLQMRHTARSSIRTFICKQVKGKFAFVIADFYHPLYG